MKLIDKDVLVAEIKRRIANGEEVFKEVPSSAILGLIQAYKNALFIINTLEVKELGQVKESTEIQHDNKTCKENDDSLTSEDERIRKMLIEFFGKGAERNGSTNGISDKDILDWLEKQKPVNENEFAKGVLIRIAISIMQWLDANLAEGNMCLSNMECEDLENAVRNDDWQKVYGYMKKKLEKQGIKPQGKSALEAIHEQNPDNANKVERKFKVGDFIANDYCKGKVIELTADAYLLDTEQGIPFSCEHNAHIWSIQDAKDGDILTFDNNVCTMGIIICKSPTSYATKSYCRLIDEHFIGEEESGWDSRLIVPATKEQRDTFFTKMKEAGYRWNSTEKKLEEIESNESENKGKERGISPNWSEEDEHRLNDTIYFLDTAKKHYASTEELDACIEWLKMIKPSVGYNPYKAAINSITEMCEKYEFKGEMARDFLNNIKAKCNDAKQYEEMHC